MKSIVGAAASFLLAASLLAAPSLRFSEPAPVTNLRYANLDATLALTSNGHDFFALWADGGGTKIARLGTTEQLLGRPVTTGSAPVVVWTGQNFLVAAEHQLRVLDANGVPVGPDSAILPANAESAATNGRNVVILAGDSNGVRAYVFDLHGVALNPAGQPIDSSFAFHPAIASNGSGYVSISPYTNDNQVRISTFDESGALRSQQTIGSANPRTGAIASDGSSYLAAWSEGDGTVRAMHVLQDGTLGPPFMLTATAGGPTSVVWTGDRYAVAISESGQQPRARVVYATASGPTGEPVLLEGASYRAPRLLASGGRLLVSWGSYVRDLLAPAGGTTTHFLAANGQSVLQWATGSESTLIVWTEERSRMGVRGRNGSWSERELPDGTAKRVATDGRGFIVTNRAAGGTTATYYEADGTPRWSGVAIPFFVDTALWNGREFILSGSTGTSGLMAVRLSASGVVSAPVALQTNRGYAFGTSRLATDGTNILLVYAVPHCTVPCVGSDGLIAVLYDSELRPLTQPADLAIKTYFLQYLSLAWDGEQYVVVYSGNTNSDYAIFAKGISAGGIPETQWLELSRTPLTQSFKVSPTPYGTAVVWGVSGDDGRVTDEVRLISQNGEVSTIAVQSGSGGLLTTLPDGKLGYFTSHLLNGEPYYGAWRIRLSIGDVAGPDRVPDAPKLSVTLNAGGTLRAQWTAPQPVNGYRVEYKIGSQDWMELEGWFGPNDRTLTVTPAGNPALYSFRVRAWNDAGTSPYSAPASLPPSKRRSVR